MVPINYLAVLAAGIVNMIIGFFWYSPMAFGNSWMKLSGISKKDMEKGKKDFPKLMAVSFVATLLMAYILKHVTVYSGAYNQMSGVSVGLISAFWMWLGFIMPVQLTSWIFEKTPFQLFILHTGYQLVSMLAMGAVLTLWM